VNDVISVSVLDIEALATRALRASNVSDLNAEAVARSIAAAERDGQPTVGLSYLPTYCDHAACGKVDGNAKPALQQLSSASIRVDAHTGFAHPALALGLPYLADAARRQGVAVLAVGNSYACGSLGYFVETLAEQGLVALMVANASPSIAPHGGRMPFFGTNPLAFATPRVGRPPLVIDQSTSVVAKVAVLDAKRRGVPLPPGWALDASGNPTCDADAAMEGSLCAIGGYKGTSLALLIDVLAGGLTASNFSFEASSFGDCAGGPPRTGQIIIALDPALFGGAQFTSRTESLFDATLREPRVRLPGERRLAARRRHQTGIEVPADIWALIQRYAVEGSPLLAQAPGRDPKGDSRA
jgi:(2R)-3-sulfolactate dehydrogenase (NADP+)